MVKGKTYLKLHYYFWYVASPCGLLDQNRPQRDQKIYIGLFNPPSPPPPHLKSCLKPLCPEPLLFDKENDVLSLMASIQLRIKLHY